MKWFALQLVSLLVLPGRDVKTPSWVLPFLLNLIYCHRECSAAALTRGSHPPFSNAVRKVVCNNFFKRLASFTTRVLDNLDDEINLHEYRGAGRATF